MSFVLDASLTMAWCFGDEATEHTSRVLRVIRHTRAIAPSLWFYEVSNAMVAALRKGRATAAGATEFFDVLADMPIDVQPTPPHTSAIAALVREIAVSEKLSAYDASYVALAIHSGLPLGTLDGSGKRLGMKQAAQRRGVTLFDPAAA